MPIYEYHCEPCAQTFETLIRTAEDVARCPRCGNVEVSKQFSVPAAAQTGASYSSSSSSLPISPGGGCGRPQCGSGGCAFG